MPGWSPPNWFEVATELVWDSPIGLMPGSPGDGIVVGGADLAPLHTEGVLAMSHKQLILAFFADGAAADSAALAVEASGVAEGDAIGVLVLDSAGNLVVDKVGATSVAAGAGVGAALLVLGPAALGLGAAAAVVGGGVGIAGGAVGGSLHHKGLKLSDEQKEQIAADLTAGKAAVGVLAHGDVAAAVHAKLTQLGGAASTVEVVDPDALQASAEG